MIDWLNRRLDAEQEADLLLAVHYPTSWDQFFMDLMTSRTRYRYATQHFVFHLRQLTPTVADELDRPPTPGRPMAGAPLSPIFSRRSGSGYTGGSNLLVPTSTRAVSRPTGLQNTPSRA
ncbi:hypothetical protein [Streptomyces pilosus]|uniref:Uncharacterized protein n=1 Tax=Streptomyces pilosus TaxID=28893 RepID=A0A918C742_9ACTN|nr:hypothetical protein [Streptomyces pilosus]GGR08276.1 hypothetical protein GCM10010280_65110 [Streptomyces pilosus]